MRLFWKTRWFTLEVRGLGFLLLLWSLLLWLAAWLYELRT